MERKKLEELNLMDDFLFHAVLTHPEVGEAFTKKILELVFHREFQNLKVIAQKAYGGMNTDLRGARLDVYVEANDAAMINAATTSTIYDLEPDQNSKQAHITAFPKRVRFYHAIIDSRSLKSGEDFGKLKNVYVIFICNYDPFGCDRMQYTIKNMCVEDPSIPYEDGAQTIVLYTKGSKGEISNELHLFLNYMEHTNSTYAVSDTLKEIQEMVDIVKRDGEVSLAYMKSFEHDQMMYEEGHDAGRNEERKNTEKERERAEKERQRASLAEELNRSLSEKLRAYESKYGALPIK